MLPRERMKGSGNHTLIFRHSHLIPKISVTNFFFFFFFSGAIVIPRLVTIQPLVRRLGAHELGHRLGRVLVTRSQTRELDDLAEFVRRGVLVGLGGRRRVVHGGGLCGGGLDVAWGGGGGAGEGGGELREVEDGGVAFDGECCHVMRTRRHFGGGEGAEPDPALFLRLANLGNPFSPRPHSDPTVHRVAAVRRHRFAAPLLGAGAAVGGRRGGSGEGVVVGHCVK